MGERAPATAGEFLAAVHRAAAPAELPVLRRRLGPDDDAVGIRMRDLFDLARAAADMPLDEVAVLLASPLYEARMGALCVLDVRARRRDTDDAQRRRLYDLYLSRHDRITTWDMVDRAAPSVVGRYLLGRSPAPLHGLAAAADPLRRRTAVTAPLAFVRWGDDAALAEVFPLAAVLAGDPDPLVHKAVGILLEHAGGRDPEAVAAFVAEHRGSMPRHALRTAVAKLDAAERGRLLG
ncbi:DNA alkylation repair protein [Geodermatophilus nigrescens]|uniref:3-methyladenine DNA glycosylase AlkD n=1 Tax=Geodermatophilus nigrescens TaxID=1070870 RepID=A0A1M5IA46_9ACTN|nr:DNA alkylation repair protein [Geodermatophilus nigrescens]SHG24760.1 3-methyladenine DNA glycosylase AlkD [Geodermatophilus nigrescens]